MSTDFLDAHKRHMLDGETLFHASRIANADQLFGVAVECGLKRLMIRFGMVVKPDGSPTERDDRQHANKLWSRYETYRSAYSNAYAYILPSQNPYEDWSIEQRYVDSADILLSTVEKHREAANKVAALVKKAQLEGVI